MIVFMRPFYLILLLFIFIPPTQAKDKTLPPISACGPTHYELASFPEELPSLGNSICATTKNIASGKPKLIHQNYIIDNTTLNDFLDTYSKKLTESGWEITNQDNPGVGPSGFMLSIQAKHPKGYSLQIVMSDIMQRGLAAFKLDKEAMQRINLKLILADTQ